EMEALKQQALQQTETIQDIEARLAAMETIFRKSPIVTDVKTGPKLKQISVTWTYIGVEHIQIAPTGLLPTDESESQVAVQERRMQEFWTVVGGGHSVAFGDDYYIIG